MNQLIMVITLLLVYQQDQQIMYKFFTKYSAHEHHLQKRTYSFRHFWWKINEGV